MEFTKRGLVKIRRYENKKIKQKKRGPDYQGCGHTVRTVVSGKHMLRVKS